MIIHDDTHPADFADFGISIPVSNSRTQATFDHLIRHPRIGPLAHRWHLPKVEESLDQEDLRRVHSADYVERLFGDGLAGEIIRTYELIGTDGEPFRYHPKQARLPLFHLFERILYKAGGTVQCCRVAIENGFCYYFGGGMHHAQESYGKGFCLVNDIVIAIRKLQAERRIRSAWVIDVDAHKGDGTAALTRNDPSITTLSIHMAAGWPLDGPKRLPDGSPNPSFLPSDVDIGIAPGEESAYLERLEEGLARLDAGSRPDIAVVVGGADPYEKDTLPSAQDLKLSLSQLLERDVAVYRFLTDRGIPYAGLMAGGYGDHSWEVYAQFLEWALMRRLTEGGVFDPLPEAAPSPMAP
jgi:acetoin utilization deacetylase AcuC-like enzyme